MPPRRSRVGIFANSATVHSRPSPHVAVQISVRVLSMPLPCRFDNLLELWVARLPDEFAADFFAAGHEHGRIAGASRAGLGGNRMPCDPPGGFDHIPHAEALAVAEIVDA